MILRVDLEEYAVDEAMEMSNAMGVTLEDFLTDAIHIQAQLNRVILEREVKKLYKDNLIPVDKYTPNGYVRVLWDKGIPFERVTIDGKDYIKTPISQEDFDYCQSVADNHTIFVKLKKGALGTPDSKKREICRMYPVDGFV